MKLFIYLLTLFTFSVVAEKGSPCVTPNGENATCITINSCRVIIQALQYLNKDAVEFAKQSQCGFESGPLVCCGTVGKLTTPAPAPAREVFTQAPTNLNKATTVYTPLESFNLPDDSICGIQLKQTDNRIVGGTASDLDEFPWMVALKYEKDDGTPGGFRCGGTLIHSKYVLTAAQCANIKGYNLIEVRLGEWRFSTDNDCVLDTEQEEVCSDAVVDVPIVEKILHPFFSIRSGNNDIALLKLEKKVKFTEYIRPICLPPANLPVPEEGTLLYISGWGITDNGKESDIKQKVKIPVLSNKECYKVFTNYTHINPNQSCAGGEGGKDACNGDSGGPLMITFEKKNKDDEQQWYQEGIIYRGIGCGRKGVPSLYTRINRYTQWIVHNLEER